MSHTPGPWKIGRCGSVVADEPINEISGSDDVEYYGGYLIAESIAKKNATLIAAAPDLLQALKAMRDVLEIVVGKVKMIHIAEIDLAEQVTEVADSLIEKIEAVSEKLAT